MDENLLLIAFAIFAVLVLIIAFVLRGKTVDDIFSDDKSSSMTDLSFGKVKSPTPAISNNTLSTARATRSGANKPAFELNRKNINKIGKILGAIGAVMIIAPLPSTLDSIGFGFAFVGYLMARFTNQPSEQKTRSVKSPQVDMLRKLASKPEYREAMQILAADMADKQLMTEFDRQARAIRYLQSKGVSAQDASRNVALLAAYIAQQKKK